MAVTQLSKKQLKALVQESVKEAFRIELVKLRAMLIPLVSEAEQRDIERRYKAPSRKAIATHAVKL